MKCQKCDKPATFHITELTDGKLEELHLCEEHAREYLTQSSDSTTPVGDVASAMAQQMQLSKTAQELAELDEQVCPVCGISFFEFRKQGRLGCPHDYICFQPQLEPLILNVHGETTHVGKRPARSADESERRTQLIRMRRDMEQAITDENYEAAGKLRDTIRQIEGETL